MPAIEFDVKSLLKHLSRKRTMNRENASSLLKGMDLSEIRKASLLFRALDNPVRYKIASIIEQHGKQTATGLLSHSIASKSITSLHVSILTRENILKTTWCGRQLFYELNYKLLDQVHYILRVLK